MFFSSYTLGCKLNQLESEAIADSFCQSGFSFVPWGSKGPSSPSLLIINTCTVTSMAEQKARRVIRKALKCYPESCLVVTGCYAQLEKAALEALDDSSVRRLFVIPGEKKDSVMDLALFLAGSSSTFPSGLSDLISSWADSLGVDTELQISGRDAGDGAFRFRPLNFTSHSRGFLKVQDGCDKRCSYCRVSLARGKSTSIGAQEALDTLRSLEGRGFNEAVLTGVNITQYRGSDERGSLMGLPELLDFLLTGTDKIRLRLSSVEPDFLAPGENTDNFIRLLANQRIRPHFHLSLQSGSPEILKKMGRSYTPSDVENTVKLLRSVRDDPFIACDIIAGFPGEGAAEFEETLGLCERTGFAWIHAFHYSPRPGTEAFNFPGRVAERDALTRVEALTELARKGKRDYINRWAGKEVEAVIEAGGSFSGKQGAPGVSENYLKLLINPGKNSAPPPRTLVQCRISSELQYPDGSLLNVCPGDHVDAIAEQISCV